MTVTVAASKQSVSDKEAPLRGDIRLLGNILGETIRAQEGEAAFMLIETVRQTAIRFRRGDDTEREQLSSLLDGLSFEQAIPIIRAFSYFSHLANIAEDQHHIRRARLYAIDGSAPRDGTIMRALQRAHDANIDISTIEAFFATALVCPVLTAHPTEVQRKSTLDRERELAKLVAERDRPSNTPE